MAVKLKVTPLNSYSSLVSPTSALACSKKITQPIFTTIDTAAIGRDDKDDEAIEIITLIVSHCQKQYRVATQSFTKLKHTQCLLLAIPLHIHSRASLIAHPLPTYILCTTEFLAGHPLHEQVSQSY